MINAYVISIFSIKESMQAANRCIKSAKEFGIDVKKFKAFTPDDNPITKLREKGIDASGMKEVYSRMERAAAGFLSHLTLWEKCANDCVKYLIFEHDAVVVDKIPVTAPFEKVMTIGKPSYGKFKTPATLGVGPLIHKRYFGGAHAYMLNPDGAKELVLKAKSGKAIPTDVFLNLDNFPWLQEYYPWPAEAHDSFSTIQNTNGCLAKHNYGEGYHLL